MNTSLILLLVLIVGLAGFIVGRSRALSLAGGKLSALHSRPNYYGAYVAISALLPSLLVLAIWLIASPMIVESSVRNSLPQSVHDQGAATTELTIGTVHAVAGGLKLLNEAELAAVTSGSSNLREILAAKGVPLAGESDPFMIQAAQKLNSMTAMSRMLMAIVVLVLAVGGAILSIRNIAVRFRARNRVEQVMLATLVLAS